MKWLTVAGVAVCVQLRNEKSELEGTLAREQEHQMQKLLKHIERLQNEVSSKQETLDQVNCYWIVLSFCVSDSVFTVGLRHTIGARI